VIRRHVLVHGRVQGVWFRETTRRTAEGTGVSGWVRNTADGAVEAVFEGPEHAVEALVAFCADGPPRARVDRVDVREEPPEGIDGFAVRGW
jgi:acylphosphatase